MSHLDHHLPRQPLVSIITIVLNGKRDIRRTMDSVLAQSYQHVEYIVIDGGSTDGTLDIIEEYASRLHHWQSEKDDGISDAFNKGINLAKGDIIGLINSGDWYETDALQYIVDAFLHDEKAGVVCGALQFWRGDQRGYLCCSVPELLHREMSVTHPTCFILAGLYRRFGLFAEEYRLAMDYELLLRLKCGGVSFVTLAKVLANMQHQGVSEKNWRSALGETHRARRALLGRSFYCTTCYYYFLICKRGIRITLERLGLERVLRFYRCHLALVKKTKI